MDEGVDPTQMCQSLVDRVAQSEQLMAVADPEVLGLFEDWLEEMEGEVVAFVKQAGSMNTGDLAKGLGISLSGASFFVAKLKREGKR